VIVFVFYLQFVYVVKVAVVFLVIGGFTVGDLAGKAVRAGKIAENASTVRACAVFALAMAKSTIPRDCSAAEADEFVSARPILAATHSNAMPRLPAATTHRSWHSGLCALLALPSSVSAPEFQVLHALPCSDSQILQRDYLRSIKHINIPACQWMGGLFN
jgi:hypothetical protein